MFVECARALAREVVDRGGPTDGERVAYAFRRVLGRTPADDERRVLLRLLQSQSKRIADGRVDATALATGMTTSPTLTPGVSMARLAAYTIVSRVLLNLDETMTKE